MSKRKLTTFFAMTPKKKKPLPDSGGGITEYCIPISEPTSPRDILRTSEYTKRTRNRKKLFTLITTLLQNYPSDICSCDLKLNFGGKITKKKFAKIDGVAKEIVVIADKSTNSKSIATQAYMPSFTPAYIPVTTNPVIVPDNLLHLNCQRDFVNMRKSLDGSFIINTFFK